MNRYLSPGGLPPIALVNWFVQQQRDQLAVLEPEQQQSDEREQQISDSAWQRGTSRIRRIPLGGKSPWDRAGLRDYPTIPRARRWKAGRQRSRLGPRRVARVESRGQADLSQPSRPVNGCLFSSELAVFRLRRYSGRSTAGSANQAEYPVNSAISSRQLPPATHTSVGFYRRTDYSGVSRPTRDAAVPAGLMFHGYAHRIREAVIQAADALAP